jgi:hypothetical protein
VTRLSRHSGGQALVLALFLLLAGAAALLQLFDAGQLVHEKVRLTHAADAAAYSGALVQARALNFQAYANRAQVAHQVAMAHLVTLASWAKFGAAEARQAGAANPPAGVVGMLFGAGHGAAYAASRQASGLDAAAQAQGSLGRAFAEHDSVVHEVLWRAQQAVAYQLARDREAAMRAVLQANYSDAAPVTGGAVLLDDVPLADALPGYLAVRAGQNRTRLREMVLQATSRYGFLDDRHDTARNPWVVSSRCPHRRHELRRRGTTTLEGFDTWSAADTQSYHALRSNRWIGCYHREYPMGWAMTATGGAVDASPELVADPPPDFSAEDFWRWATRNTTWNIFTGTGNPLASSRALAGATAWRGRGMPGYVDLASPGNPDRPLRFAIRVMRAQDSVATLGHASRVRTGPGLLDPSTDLPGGMMAAVSAAETWFERPAARGDGSMELASLFSPYWQARLSEVRESERAQARARQGES